MSPIVRAAKLMLNGLIFIILITFAIWCAAFIYLLVVYGPFEAIVFATGKYYAPRDHLRHEAQRRSQARPSRVTVGTITRDTTRQDYRFEVY